MNKKFYALIAGVIILVVVAIWGYWRVKGFDGEDKPSVVENMMGNYKFIISNKVFLVPGRYVQGYGIASDGALNNFTVRLRGLRSGGEAEIIVSFDLRSKRVIEKYWYDNMYQYYRRRLTGWKESARQGGERLEATDESAFLMKGNRVLRMLSCGKRICRVFIAYADNLTLYIVLDKKLQRDWLGLTEKLIMDLLSFEQSGRAVGR
ncbi:hypothetical protein [Pseudomonas indica]|uniref:Uncharacterized protein n=1 Tax=Pseudomonas indica TaxID=137658 RepID=A0A1G9AZ82_9PSED|nr:hypothetical protein [Pseudomonas indica]SDK32639.1 hypothetical protein SAMN05216186_10690 [Pseudomonas indica]